MIPLETLNHLFIGVVLVAGYGLLALLPARLPRSLAAIVILMSLALPLMMDHTVGTPPIDLYDTNIQPWLTVSDVLTWCMYPIFGYLFVYLLDRWNVRGLGIPLYVAVWAFAAAAFEALNVYFGVFNYKGWSLRYSFIVYLFTELLLLIVFRILRGVFIRARKV